MLETTKKLLFRLTMRCNNHTGQKCRSGSASRRSTTIGPLPDRFHMDTLSRLLSLCTIRTSLDIRCSLAAPWVLDEPSAAPGAAPFHLVVDGSATVDLPDGGPLLLHAGDIVVFAHGAAHRLHAGPRELATPAREVASESPLRWKTNAGANDGASGGGAPTGILCGRFEFDDGARRMLQRALPQVVVVRSAGRPDFAGLHALVTMLRNETDASRPGAALVTAQLSSALFALLLRAWLEEHGASGSLLALLADRRLGPALQRMLERPAAPWLVEELAQACLMSRATFARTFRQVAGATPAAVLAELRMAQAALWLARDARPVGAIAEAVGYGSEAAFHRMFKRCHGVGPGAFRRAARA